MIHHPIVLGTKVVVLLILIIVLVILHGVLPPEQFKVAVVISIGVFAVVVLALWIGFFMMLKNPNSRLSKQMVLGQTPREGTSEEQKRLTSLLGSEGTAETNLRPSGIGRFDQDFVDVLSERGFIAKGARIIVVSVAGKVVKVREVESA